MKCLDNNSAGGGREVLQRDKMARSWVTMRTQANDDDDDEDSPPFVWRRHHS